LGRGGRNIKIPKGLHVYRPGETENEKQSRRDYMFIDPADQRTKNNNPEGIVCGRNAFTYNPFGIDDVAWFVGGSINIQSLRD
jgi:hypothetical protein